MTKRSRALRPVLVVLVLLVPALVGLTSASAAPRQPVVYDALGDSYASGFGYGNPPYGACGRSDGAYAVQLDGRMKIDLDDFAACAGATTTSLVSGGQLAALDADTDLVTLTIGGNDIGWSSAVGACLVGTDGQCAGALAFTTGKISSLLPGLLDTVYAGVTEHAPNAQVVVTGYPRLFSPEYGGFLGASPAEQQAMNDGADLLNRVVAAAAARHGFEYVDVTKRFDGHGANSPDPWLHGLDAAAFHPNDDGYGAYTAAVTAAIQPSELR
jgi:lysophospholipase L1-like esterase